MTHRHSSARAVLLPGGRHLSSQLHIVPPGTVLRRGANFSQMISGTNQLLFHEVDHLIPEIRRRALLQAEPAEGAATVADSSPNWVADVAWQNSTGTPVQQFRASWTVPNPPTTQSDQVIYLFNGIDPNSPDSAILQPVLQWGASPSGGGPFWSVATYYVMGEGPAFSTEAVPVNPGDTIEGAITLERQDQSGFSYRAEFSGLSDTVLRASSVHELVWCYITLESYGANTDNSYYPADPMTKFGNICLQTAPGQTTIPWAPETGGSNNGQHVGNVNNSSSSGEVEIYYR